VLGEFGDEVQGVEDLEVAGHVAEEVGAGGAGEPAAGPLLGQVENLAPGGHLDQTLEAERAAEQVLAEALEAGGVASVEAHAVVNAEARVAPGAHLRDDRLVDLVVCEQQVEDERLPPLLEGLGLQGRQ
jgi:hypothetical protein